MISDNSKLLIVFLILPNGYFETILILALDSRVFRLFCEKQTIDLTIHLLATEIAKEKFINTLQCMRLVKGLISGHPW